MDKALRVFGVDITNAIGMDIGAATGGFTDVLLQNGAQHVYAVDVGYGQLDCKIRSDERVTVLERTNARYLSREQIPTVPDITVMDVSFISVKLILPVAAQLMENKGRFCILIKPQFEAGKTKKGIVSSPDVHVDVILSVISFAESNGFCVKGLDFSPVKGGDGNIEFLLCLTFGQEMGKFTRKEIKELVKVVEL